nr:hypothetical protein [Tanacetum cinerariifolium]
MKKMYDYRHLEEIEVRQDDQQLYTFKEVDFKRLRLQDIKDMLLLLVQQKLTNLTIDEHFDLNLALQQLKQEKGSSYGSGDRQAALSEEVDAESGKVCCRRPYGQDLRSKSENMGIVPTKIELIVEQAHEVKMEILLEPTSNKLMVDCKASIAAMNQRAHVVNLKATITCYECGRLGHIRNECQKLRNQNQVNQIWKENVRRNSSFVKDKTNA